MAIPREISLIIGFSLMVLQGCQTGSVAENPTSTVTLRPYQTETPTVTASPVEASLNEDEPELLPTPTPFVHQVQEGETLLSIALRYGVSLDEMLAANPGLDPRFLSIDQELRIPGPEGQGAESLIPTSTPLPLELSSGTCYQSNDQSWWCLAEVENTTEDPIEGLTAKVRLTDPQDQLISTELAYAPLNRLLPGEKLPLVTNLMPDGVHSISADFSLLSAVASTEAGSRYLDTNLKIETEEPLDSKGQWRVTGEISLENPSEADNYRISVLAMGYDAAGKIVGYSKWEPETEEEQPWAFELLVFSLGPAIEQVAVSAEAITLDE